MVTTTVGERQSTGALKSLHNTQRSIEKLRVQMRNRHEALVADRDEAETPVPQLYARLTEQLEGMEEDIESLMAEELKGFPVYDFWLKHVKGVGPGLASQLLAMLLPPIPEKAVSSWYKAGGLAPEFRPEDNQSHLPRARAGQDGLSYYPWLRRCLWNLATSFVRNGGYYREVYEKEKARFQEKHSSDWAPWKIDHVARWRTVKLFLSHYHECAYFAEYGKLPPKPYILTQPGHVHYISPPNTELIPGWKEARKAAGI